MSLASAILGWRAAALAGGYPWARGTDESDQSDRLGMAPALIFFFALLASDAAPALSYRVEATAGGVTDRRSVTPRFRCCAADAERS
jgi:hypothetical protein